MDFLQILHLTKNLQVLIIFCLGFVKKKLINILPQYLRKIKRAQINKKIENVSLNDVQVSFLFCLGFFEYCFEFL